MGLSQMKTPHWIDPDWAKGLSELEYNFATGYFKKAYWSQVVGHQLLIREIVSDEERLTETYYSKKPIRHIEWRPIHVNTLETQFLNKAKGAWRIFQNPHTEEAKQRYVEMFDWHGHGCYCCESQMGDKQTAKGYVLNRKPLESHHNSCRVWSESKYKQGGMV